MPTIVPVPRFNTVLDDNARRIYAPVIATLFALAPQTMARKYREANVQQAFVLAAVVALSHDFPRSKTLSVGCYEDTAYESLLKIGIKVDGIDPNVDGQDLDKFVSLNPQRKGYYDIVFSTSVIEHVEDDERFVADIARLLAPDGYAVLTCDFNDDWHPGVPIPSVDYRFYRAEDLGSRLLGAMPGCRLIDAPAWKGFEPDFEFEGCRYSFATLVVQRSSVP